ncbi:unnamed protein product [Fusarium equiseti]|uniref:Uncharacterized protein n=1 Tax=Fusarium equiseti TaxID=61235 RepID=A0A8J2NE21_FUSEQ|nr:unnamed protein product [Fusarium equiseti]
MKHAQHHDVCDINKCWRDQALSANIVDVGNTDTLFHSLSISTPLERPNSYSWSACTLIVLTSSLSSSRVAPAAFSWSLFLDRFRATTILGSAAPDLSDPQTYLLPPRGSNDTALRRRTVPNDTSYMYTAPPCLASWAYASNDILHTAALHYPQDIDGHGSLTTEFNKVSQAFRRRKYSLTLSV